MPVVRGRVEHCSSKGANTSKVREREIVLGLTAARGGAAGSGCLGERGCCGDRETEILPQAPGAHCWRQRPSACPQQVPLPRNSSLPGRDVAEEVIAGVDFGWTQFTCLTLAVKQRSGWPEALAALGVASPGCGCFAGLH